MEPLILFGIILALALNFVNGLNDACTFDRNRCCNKIPLTMAGSVL